MTGIPKRLADYLGTPTKGLLADVPFRDWSYEVTTEDGLEEPIIQYVFASKGLELRADKNDRIATIFVEPEGADLLQNDLTNVSFSWRRGDVRRLLGPPSKSRNAFTDPVLGKYGPWDRFARTGYAIHIEYSTDHDTIRRITLMREDVVPS